MMNQQSDADSSRADAVTNVTVTFSPTQLARACGFSSALSALVALLLFLGTPWLAVTCQGERVMTQTGMQAMYGGATVHPAMDMDAEEVEQELDSEDEEVPTGWSLGLLGLGLAVTVALGLVVMRTLNAGQAKLLLGTALLATVVLLWHLSVGFPLERALEQDIRDAQEQAEQSDDPFAGMELAFVGMVNIERTGWLTTATVFTLLSTLLAGLALGTVTHANRPESASSAERATASEP